jgi:hypothetical protein
MDQITKDMAKFQPTHHHGGGGGGGGASAFQTYQPAPQQQQPKEKCPPCPSCARCPEPAFDCKKVPNYNAMNNEFLPIPVLNDFSSFGM